MSETVFEPGEVWVSPKGFVYKVIEVVPYGSRGRPMAVMRSGRSGSGRLFRKWATDTVRWERCPLAQNARMKSEATRSDEPSQRLETLA